MPLLNYTTEVPAERSIAEIIRILQEGGASAIGMENSAEREVVAISFVMETAFGRVPYQLPANVPQVTITLNEQIRAETVRVNKGRGYKRKIPQRLFNDKAQASRIAWRIAKDWLEAQLALTAIDGAKLEQIMMPFAMIGGKSFYHHMVERGSLALPAAKGEPEVVVPI